MIKQLNFIMNYLKIRKMTKKKVIKITIIKNKKNKNKIKMNIKMKTKRKEEDIK